MKKSRKLRLSRETLRNLEPQDFSRVRGGAITDWTCVALGCGPTLGDNTCINCPHQTGSLCC